MVFWLVADDQLKLRALYSIFDTNSDHLLGRSEFQDMIEERLSWLLLVWVTMMLWFVVVLLAEIVIVVVAVVC